MHVFITGGSGLIGSAVIAELIDNGHTVLALARSDSSQQAVEASVSANTRRPVSLEAGFALQLERRVPVG